MKDSEAWGFYSRELQKVRHDLATEQPQMYKKYITNENNNKKNVLECDLYQNLPNMSWELYSDFFQKFLVFSSIPKLSLKTQLSLEWVSSHQKHELLLGLH